MLSSCLKVCFRNLVPQIGIWVMNGYEANGHRKTKYVFEKGDAFTGPLPDSNIMKSEDGACDADQLQSFKCAVLQGHQLTIHDGIIISWLKLWQLVGLA